MVTQRRKGLIALGVAMGLFGIVMIAKKAAGGGNGGGNRFSFGKPAIDTLVYAPAPGWTVPIFTCQVTNNNDQQVTRTLHVRVRVDYPGQTVERDVSANDVRAKQVINIGPGDSVIFEYDGSEGMNETTPPPTFLMGQQATWHFWLQDDLGNKSSEVSVDT